MRRPSVSRKARSGDISTSSSCPGLSRASTSSRASMEKDVDGRDIQREDAPCAFAWPRRNRRSHPVHRHRNLRAVLDGLVDHAIALGKFQQEIELLLRRVGIDVETQTHFGKADRSLLVDAERAAKIQIALGGHEARL